MCACINVRGIFGSVSIGMIIISCNVSRFYISAVVDVSWLTATMTFASSPSQFSSTCLWPPAHQMSSMLVPSRRLMCGALAVQC